MTPATDTRPNVGFNPTQPQKLAGTRTLPPVSLPTLPAANRAATTAVEPPDDPPGTRVGSNGLRVAPKWGLVVVSPKASSCIFELAKQHRASLG